MPTSVPWCADVLQVAADVLLHQDAYLLRVPALRWYGARHELRHVGRGVAGQIQPLRNARAARVARERHAQPRPHLGHAARGSDPRGPGPRCEKRAAQAGPQVARSGPAAPRRSAARRAARRAALLIRGRSAGARPAARGRRQHLAARAEVVSHNRQTAIHRVRDGGLHPCRARSVGSTFCLGVSRLIHCTSVAATRRAPPRCTMPPMRSSGASAALVAA